MLVVLAVLRRLALTTLLAAAAAAAAAPVGAAPSSRCHRQPGERLVAHAPQAVVFLDEAKGRVTGCLRRSGRRWRFYEDDGDSPATTARSLKLVGTRVIYPVYDASSPHGFVEEIVVGDLGARRLRLIGRLITESGQEHVEHFGELALRADGTAALVRTVDDETRALTLVLRGGAERRVSTSRDISRVRFSGRMLRWHEPDGEHAVVATPPERCPPALRSGTVEVGVAQRGDVVTACWRATGQLVHVAGALKPEYGDAAHRLDIAGSLVAVPLTADGIAVLDARRGTAIAFAAPGVSQVVVDDACSVAWVATFGAGEDRRSEVWVRDGAGRRLAGTTKWIPYLNREGSTVRWSGDDSEQHEEVLAP